MANDVSATPTREELPTPTTTNRVFGMQINQEMDEAIGETAARHSLTKSSVARMALVIGLPILNDNLDGGNRP